MMKTLLQTTSEGCEIILYRSFGSAYLGASVASPAASWLNFFGAVFAKIRTRLRETCNDAANVAGQVEAAIGFRYRCSLTGDSNRCSSVSRYQSYAYYYT